MVSFVIQRSGRVVGYSLLRRSGRFQLDHAIESMMASIPPAPSIPAGVPVDRLELTLRVTLE